MKLGLENAEVMAVSAEDVKERYDAVTSRAFHSLKDSYPIMRPLLRDGGAIMLYKGMMKTIRSEIEETEKAYGVSLTYKIDNIRVPFLDEERNLLTIL